MDDDGQRWRSASASIASKRLDLRLDGRVHAVEVEADLADRDDLRVCASRRFDVAKRCGVELRGLVGVVAGGGVDALVALGQRDGGLRASSRSTAGTTMRGYAGSTRALDDGVAVVGELRLLEVGVACRR